MDSEFKLQNVTTELCLKVGKELNLSYVKKKTNAEH